MLGDLAPRQAIPEHQLNNIALGWRQVGMQVDFTVFSQASSGDNEARSPYPGVEIGGATIELFLSTRKSCKRAGYFKQPDKLTGYN